MTAIFVPILDRWPSGAGWCVSGIAEDFAESLASSTGIDLDLAEMAGVATVGRVVKVELGSKGMLVEAEVTSKIAVEKVAENVYRGFGVVATRDANGDMIIQRIALIDAPSALEKRSVSARQWAFLHVEKGLKMNLPINRLSDEELVRQYGHISVGAGATDANERAVLLIKAARQQGQTGASDRDFCKWLQARAQR